MLQSGVGGAPGNVMAGSRHARLSRRLPIPQRRTRELQLRPDMPLISSATPNAQELAELKRLCFRTSRNRIHTLASGSSVAQARANRTMSRGSCRCPTHRREGSAQARHVVHGVIDRHTFASRLLGNERNVWVYTPPGYATSERAYPVLVVFDGGRALTRVPIHRLLDNLLADGRIAPAVAVFIDNPTRTRATTNCRAARTSPASSRRRCCRGFAGAIASHARGRPLRHRRQLRRPGVDVDGLPTAARVRQRDQPGGVAVVGAGLHDEVPRTKAATRPSG